MKTFKRDYVRVTPIPDAAAAVALLDSWIEDYNTVHPHSRLGYRSCERKFKVTMVNPRDQLIGN